MLWSWFVSAVARALKPGCKVDTSLVLVGPQGIGKSSFFRILGGEWFSDSAVDIESKDAMLQINSAWIYELGELDHVTSRSHAGRIKAFVSSQVDTYRAPYARTVEAIPRHNVIVGSTNQTQFLTDATGDRRFWVVSATRVDTDALRRDRDQLWAEAVEQYRRGYGWWLGADAERAREEATETHRVADPWEDAVASWLAALSPHEARAITTQRLLTGACGVEIERIGTRESARVAQIMRRLGWEQRVLRLAGRSTRVWHRDETP
jgi:putative DNA primase/helicase